jgi:hypothetical protein
VIAVAEAGGRIVRPPLAPEDPRHGTLNAYSNLGCRCRPCKGANAASVRVWLADPAHRRQHQRQERLRRARLGRRSNRLRANDLADPLYRARWASPRVGGLWRLLLALYSLEGAAESADVFEHHARAVLAKAGRLTET